MLDQSRLERILLIAAAALFAVIALGTLFSFAAKKARPGAHLRRFEPLPAAESAEAQQNQRGKKRLADGGKALAYTGLGQIRIPVKNRDAEEDAQIVLVSPWFLYPADDAPFYEELSAKSRKLKLLFSDYFSQGTMDELLSRGETNIKADLLALINDELTLGTISALFFDEYVFFD
jgi:flagellar basal body-associated protein FliL